MSTVNLLPWRAAQREEKKKVFLIILAVTAATALIISVVWGHSAQRQIDSQLSRNVLLEMRIGEIGKKVEVIKTLKSKRKKMLERMALIKGLQGNRSGIVKVFDSFVRSIPDGVFFTEMNRTGGSIALVGFSESNKRIATLMRQLDASDQFKEPSLTMVEADTTLGAQGSRFELHLILEMASTTQKGEGF